jgi:predicted acetyltransferase
VTANATIVAVAPGDEGPLANLLQLYQYDFSEIEPIDVAADGRFHQLDDVPFEHAYLVYSDGQLAGFALVGRQESHAVEGDATWSMAEFFIMRKYRRAAIGTDAARLVIDRHPGTWGITQTPNNTVARSFWRQALAPYSFKELTYDDPNGGRRSLQRFSR